MSRIQVRHFGPIQEGIGEDQWIDLGKVTLFIGCQGSGKSTIAKLISTFSWIEKALTRGDYMPEHFTKEGYFRDRLCSYHRIENYFHQDTEIRYEGNYYHITYTAAEGLQISATEASRLFSKVSYIPSDRNAVSTLTSYKQVKDFPPYLDSFVSDFDQANRNLKEAIRLPLSDLQARYDKEKEDLVIQGDGYQILLQEASSGTQSLTPLYLVSKFFSDGIARNRLDSSQSGMSSADREAFMKLINLLFAQPELTDEQRRLGISEIARKFNPQFLISIIEEPEQNLYPEAQRDLLFDLLEQNNQIPENRLILTSHSPYLVNYLTIIAKASLIQRRIEIQAETSKKQTYLDRLNEILPLSAITPAEEIKIYECGAPRGSVKLLKTIDALPSSDNLLNQALQESNEYIDRLFDIEDELD